MNIQTLPGRSKAAQGNAEMWFCHRNRSDEGTHLCCHSPGIPLGTSRISMQRDAQGGFEKLSKGREDPALLALHSTQPCCRYPDNTRPRGGQRKAGKQLDEAEPKLQRKAGWRKFQPQFSHFWPKTSLYPAVVPPVSSLRYSV